MSVQKRRVFDFMGIRGLVFDFDGLILDTEGPDYRSWQELFAEHDCSLPVAVWAANLGTGAPALDLYGYLEEQCGSPIDRALLRARRRQRHAELIATETVLAGVEAYIGDAQRLGLRLGVASSSSRAWVSEHLKRLGILDCFHCLACGDDVEQTKPAPDVYLKALALLKLMPQEALALEDSPNGITAAKRAGLFCIAVPNGLTRQLALDHADLRVGSLADLPLELLLTRVGQY